MIKHTRRIRVDMHNVEIKSVAVRFAGHPDLAIISGSRQHNNNNSKHNNTSQT
jgi:hypothetical protein